MRVISNKALIDFEARYPAAGPPLQAWRKIAESRTFTNFAEIKATFDAVDKVHIFYVFNIGGSKYRVVAAINFLAQKLFIRHVFTHREYDKWTP